MNPITFEIPGEPIPWARPRISKHGKFFTQGNVANWLAYVKMYASQYAPPQPLDCPLEVTMFFFLPRPPSRPKKDLYPDRKPDIDNLSKGIMDCLEGLFWINDSRICDKHSKKRYDVKPRIVIEIRGLV